MTSTWKPKRTHHAQALEQELGQTRFTVSSLDSGWPSLCRVRLDGEWRPVALYAGYLIEGGQGRGRPNERRVEPPGKGRPIKAVKGHQALFVGFHYDSTEKLCTCIGWDAERRLDKPTRASAYVTVQALKSAELTGWGKTKLSTGEVVHTFQPKLFAEFAVIADPTLPHLQELVDPSEDEKHPDFGAQDRVQKAVMRAVRRTTFGRKVIEAYGNECAMCGLNSGYVEGAHIFPVEANGADEIWNGIALCPNHHRAFDRHQMHIHPESFAITAHPDLRQKASSHSPTEWLVATRTSMTLPSQTKHRPRAKMLERRYKFYKAKYDWTP